MRGALGPEGQLFQAFPLGGAISKLEISDAAWREFVPADGAADMHLIQTPVVEGGRVVHVNSATFPDLTDGAAVTAEHLDLCVDVYPGQDIVGTDRGTGTRFFYAIADVTGVTATMRFMRAG